MGIESDSLPRFLPKLPGECNLQQGSLQLIPNSFCGRSGRCPRVRLYRSVSWAARWHRDGQQVLWFDIEGPCSPCQVDVKKSGLCKGPGNVRDGGVAGSNENKFVVGVAMWLS